MSDKRHIIELNGKRYDALTGRVLSVRKSAPGSDGRVFAKPRPRTGVALDGFTKPSKTLAKQVHHKAERSKTLMRHAVQKPTAPKKPSSPQLVRQQAKTHLAIDPARASRAKKTHKNHLVSRFGELISPKAIMSVLPVRPEPESTPPPILDQHRQTPLDEKLQKPHFQQALAKATSHTQPRAKKPTRHQRLSSKLRVHPRAVNVAAVSLAVLLLTGFVAYQNVPNLSMRIATARAGVPGSLPTYQPAGFGLSGPIKHQPGQITISFKSHSDERAFHIKQRSTGWSDTTLLKDFVLAKKLSYQTYQDGARTIYIYDGDSATWIEAGVWYQIEGNSSLTSDQLLRLAGSM